MLTKPTLDTLRAHRPNGMAEAFAVRQTQDGIADLTHAEWLGQLIDREATSRETQRFESRMRRGAFAASGQCFWRSSMLRRARISLSVFWFYFRHLIVVEASDAKRFP